MDISLSPSLEHFVQEKIENGGYQSANEVISDALRLLQERERPREELIEQLRKEIGIGLEQADSGETAPLDVEFIKARGREVLAERQRGT